MRIDDVLSVSCITRVFSPTLLKVSVTTTVQSVLDSERVVLSTKLCDNNCGNIVLNV